jgi:hypothetical protein
LRLSIRVKVKAIEDVPSMQKQNIDARLYNIQYLTLLSMMNTKAVGDRIEHA